MPWPRPAPHSSPSTPGLACRPPACTGKTGWWSPPKAPSGGRTTSRSRSRTAGISRRRWRGAAMRSVQLDPTIRQRLKRDGGLRLLSLQPDAPASRAGLLIGDLIVAIDGHSVDGFDHLLDVLGGEVVGKTLRLELVRAGQPVSVDVVIGERPRSARSRP